MNSTINQTVSISSVQGDYDKSSSGLALKLVIIDSIVTFLPNAISTFFPNLLHFGVVRSRLEFLQSENFIGMETTKYLHLQQNKIETFTDKTFSELKNLRKIDLSDNAIRFLPSEAFNHMFHLMKFIANDNSIELFDSDVFQYNKKLKEIHFWGNKIKAIRFAAKKNARLSVLDLRKNRCIDTLFYFSSEKPALEGQNEIIVNCSSYVKKEGQLFYRISRAGTSVDIQNSTAPKENATSNSISI